MTVTLGSVDEIDSAGTSTPESNFSVASLPQPIPRGSEFPPASGLSQMAYAANDNDDASDVSMSADSDDSDDDSQNGSHGVTTHIVTQQPAPEFPVAGQKRKLSPQQDTSLVRQSWDTGRDEDNKRIKLDLGRDPALASYRDKAGRLNTDRSFLPAEIWHYIFAFTHPRALGCSLQVNKVFRAYLDPSSSPSSRSLASLSMSVVQARTTEAIWGASRRTFYPGMPSPLQGFTELEMWRLACTTKCQFCGRKNQALSSIPADPWHCGPGENGVSTIWPFAIRACGTCLQQQSAKEIDLLLSSSVPSPLMAALPFVFLTNDLHVVSSAILQQSQAPPHVQITKNFFKSHIDDILSEFFKIKSMGSGTAEEWLKGLDERGKDKRNDAAKWERWEATGGLQRMRRGDSSEMSDSVRKPKPTTTIATSASNDFPRPMLGTFGLRSYGMNSVAIQATGPPIQSEQSMSTTFSTNTPPRFNSPAQNGLPYPPRPFPQPRQERTKEEVAELKAARRAEIERRCMLLNPPLTPAVLSHMTSFQAAIQIIKPLDDSAWEVLKPRLLSQREEAEQRENDLITQNRVVQEKYDERRQLDIHNKEVKDLNDREWDDIQAPLRARISGYADEIIRDGWHGGEKVTKESSPGFAAEVLIYVRKRFYAEVAKDDAAARAAGHEPKADPSNGPFTRKLILENMKWVFDTKIKPLTEQYSKELFLCNGCENFKFYGFEGVIQHYAAKHTSSLSVGSIVVHWRAEWPEVPPFNPDPGSAVTAFHSTSKSATLYPNGSVTSPHMHGYGGYPPVSGQLTTPTQAQQHPSSYPQNPVGYYGPPQYSDQYAVPPTGHFVQAPVVQGQSAGFQGHPYQGSHAGGYQPYPGQGYPMQSFDGQYPNGASLAFESPHPSQVYPVLMPEQPGQAYPQQAAFQVTGQYDAGQYTSGEYVSGQYNAQPRPAAPVRTEEYKSQLHDIAQTAREVWTNTTGVKDMPGSVRVYVILYHILKRYRAKYPEDPPLTMLIDGLSNNKDMRPVRNVNGLACRACKLERTNEGINSRKGASKGSGSTEKKLFSLPQLLNHFQATHIEGIEPPLFDWTQDMVELPDNRRISAIARAPGMEEYKMQLIAEALPEAFRPSPPRVQHEKPDDIYPVYFHDEVERPYSQLAPSRDDHHKYYELEPQGRYSIQDRDHYDAPESSAGDMVQDHPIIVSSSNKHRYGGRQTAQRDLLPMSYVEHRVESSTPVRGVDEYGRHKTRESENLYSNLESQYRDPDHSHRERRARPSEVIPYDDYVPSRNDHGYVREVSLPRLLAMTDRLAATSAASHEVDVTNNQHKPRSTPSRPLSHASQAARNQHSSRADHIDGGSEDGELRAQPAPMRIAAFSAEAENAAERFLNQFQPGQSVEEYAKSAEEAERRQEDVLRARWEAERSESMRPILSQSADGPARAYDRFDEPGRNTVISLPPGSGGKSPERTNTRIRYERPAQHVGRFEYDDRYAASIPEAPLARPRSPNARDHRYRMNNAIYRDERQLLQTTHPVSSRYARYEDIRLENDRPRSRSPVYIKVGASSTHYREHSPSSRYIQQEPLYRSRTPQTAVQEVSYERVPRQEYYRVYAEESRARQAHLDRPVEYVQVADHQGDFLIRRPVRREPEPIYAAYSDGSFAPRPAVIETRAPLSRSDPAYYEEYDPRHPEPPPPTATRQVKYQ